MTREEILEYFKDINYAYNDCTRYDTLKRMIDELQEPCDDMGEVSDGYHTFNQLYHQRAVLFATIVNQNKDKSWKSFKHSDGNYCFDSNGEWFIVGIDTPQGSYTYHYAKEYWGMFDCEELECGKEWDGHTEEDVTRLLSLQQEPKWIPVNERLPEWHQETAGGEKFWVGERVLACVKEADEYYDLVGVATHGPYGWESSDEGFCSCYASKPVIAWMPLPEPYKASPTGGVNA